MTLSEFQATYDNAPYELRDFAYSAADVTDAPDLKQAAKDFLAAQAAFERALRDVDVEIG